MSTCIRLENFQKFWAQCQKTEIRTCENSLVCPTNLCFCFSSCRCVYSCELFSHSVQRQRCKPFVILAMRQSTAESSATKVLFEIIWSPREQCCAEPEASSWVKSDIVVWRLKAELTTKPGCRQPLQLLTSRCVIFYSRYHITLSPGSLKVMALFGESSQSPERKRDKIGASNQQGTRKHARSRFVHELLFQTCFCLSWESLCWINRNLYNVFAITAQTALVVAKNLSESGRKMS